MGDEGLRKQTMDGPEFQVNIQQPFSVVTRFHAPNGVLIGIELFYVQNGQEIHHPNSPGLGNKNIETDATCAAQKQGLTDGRHEGNGRGFGSWHGLGHQHVGSYRGARKLV